MSELKREFEKLKMRFQKEVARADHFDLPSLFKDSLVLFDRLKHELKTCKPEEKQKIVELLAELQGFLTQETRKIAARSGMTEEQLARFAENPDNFSPEQWKSMQTVKEKLSKRGQELKEAIREKSKESEPNPTRTSFSKKKPKITKSGWLKS